MPNPYKRLNVRQTIDLLVTLTDPTPEAPYRLRKARERLIEHLRAIARDKPERGRRGR